MFNFQNLSLGKKLAIASFVFIFPIILMVYYLVTEKDELIDFTRQEIAGVQYLRAAQTSLQALTASTLSKDEITAAIAKLKQSEFDYSNVLHVTQKETDLETAMNAAVAAGKASADAIGKATDLISSVSDNSNITLDPDMDGYYVGDMLVNQTTGLLTGIGTLTGTTSDLDADTAKSDDHKIAFAEARDGLATTAGTFASDLAKAIKGNTDGTVQKNLADDGQKVSDAATKVIAAAKTDDRAALTAAQAGLMQSVKDFTFKDADQMDHLMNARIKGFHSSLFARLVIVFFAVAAGILISWRITRSITKPITLITGLMGKLAKGDLDIQIPQDNRADEIGGLIAALKVFYEATMDRDKARIAEDRRMEEDKNRAKKVRELSDTFNTSVRQALGNLDTAITHLNEMASGMAQDSEMASKQTTTVAAAAEEASNNVNTVAAASEELSASIKEISSRIAQSTGIAQQAAQEAKQTRAIVHTLSEATDKIGDVVNFINEIAGQTNLLALNATIEAARAGEAGKGFAVVASEVKALANQTAKATEDITTQIVSIQDAVKNVTTAIETIDGIIGKINEVSVTISSAVEEQGAATQEIARNVQRAAQGTAEVTQNITQIAQTITASDRTSREVLASTKTLGTEAKKLESDVSGYLAGVQKT